MSRRHSRVRIGKHGVIIIPKEIREELGLRESMVLDLEVEKNKNIIIKRFMGRAEGERDKAKDRPRRG